MRKITNIQLPKPPCVNEGTSLWSIALDDSGLIIAIEPTQSDEEIIGENWNGDWLSPMGVDLQINGGLGVAFNELTNSDLPLLSKLQKNLWEDGVEAICPTLTTCSPEALRKSLNVLKKARTNEQPHECKLLGAHLEGPFLAPSRIGAHPKEYICQPSLNALDERIKDFEDQISLMTLAGELKGAKEVIKRLEGLGIRIALGHTNADAEICSDCFKQGVTMLTHTFNAMPGIHHRAPGPIGAALQNGAIAFGLIADGIHVEPSIAILLQRLAGKKLVLVSDALAPYGLQDGLYHFDQRKLIVKEGTCWLENGTLAGVNIPLLEGCKRLAKWSQNPSAAIWAATMAPRKVLNERISLESQLIGQSLLDLLRWKWKRNGECLNWHHAV